VHRKGVSNAVGPFKGCALPRDRDWGHACTAAGVIRMAFLRPEVDCHHPPHTASGFASEMGTEQLAMIGVRCSRHRGTTILVRLSPLLLHTPRLIGAVPQIFTASAPINVGVIGVMAFIGSSLCSTYIARKRMLHLLYGNDRTGLLQTVGTRFDLRDVPPSPTRRGNDRAFSFLLVGVTALRCRNFTNCERCLSRTSSSLREFRQLA